jgi:hypothetical protein
MQMLCLLQQVHNPITPSETQNTVTSKCSYYAQPTAILACRQGLSLAIAQYLKRRCTPIATLGKIKLQNSKSTISTE